jgi:hypothetical protein
MKTTSRLGPRFILGLAVAVSWPLSLSGCGDAASEGPPKDVSRLKTPSDILKEANAKEPPKEPAKKP